MPLAKRMEKTLASPVKIKLEPVDQGTEELRTSRDNLNGTIEISDDEFDPLNNIYPGPSNASDTTGQEEDCTWPLTLTSTTSPRMTGGESILDEVRIKQMKNFLDDTHRPQSIENF